MKRVLIESPYAGEVTENIAYAIACMRDSLRREEAPFASHLLYTQVLDDDVADERRQGIEAGLCWGEVACLTAVYVDRGISRGMVLGIDRALGEARTVVFRRLDREADLAEEEYMPLLKQARFRYGMRFTCDHCAEMTDHITDNCPLLDD